MRSSPDTPASSSSRSAGVLIAMLLASIAAIAASGGVETRDGRIASGRLQSLGLVAGWIEVDGSDAATCSPRLVASRPDRGRPAATSFAERGGFGGSDLAEVLERLLNTPPPSC